VYIEKSIEQSGELLPIAVSFDESLLAEIATKTSVMGAAMSLKSCGRASGRQSGPVQVFSHHCGPNRIRLARPPSNCGDSVITESVGRGNIEIARPDDLRNYWQMDMGDRSIIRRSTTSFTAAAAISLRFPSAAWRERAFPTSNK